MYLVRHPRRLGVAGRSRQRGAVAIIVALMLAVLVGFIGLAVDGGHLYLTKTELQNSADACALAASYELTGSPAIPAAAFARAEAAGRTIGRQNKVDFQASSITDGDIVVAFSTSLAAGSGWMGAGAASPASKYVRCTLTRGGIAPYFMGLLGFGAQTVSSLATASLVPAQSNCGIPLGVCRVGGATAGSTPPFGLSAGQWVSGRFKDGGGSWNWIDFSPPSGGESELSGLLKGNGLCSLNVTNPVGEPGNMGNAAAKAWNTRFGLYQSGSDNVASAPPDFTGYAYTTVNWPSGSNALADFITRRGTHASYGANVAAGNALTGLSISNAYDPTTSVAQYTTYGADRRLVVSPIIDCPSLSTSHTTAILGWACVLMLAPIDSPNSTVSMEFVGLSSDPGSPCASSGVAGDGTSAGPMVPALVQ